MIFSQNLKKIATDSYKKDSQKIIETKYNGKNFNSGFLEESYRMYAKSLKTFIPLEIYTFLYEPITPNLPFYDRKPFIWVVDELIDETTGNKTVLGININFFPYLERIKFLDITSHTFGIFNKKNETDQSRVANNIKMKQILSWKFFNDKYRKHLKNFDFCWRKYIYKEITSPVLVEREDWFRLPYYISKYTTIPIGKIWNLYNE
jgi:hypothetical protein